MVSTPGRDQEYTRDTQNGCSTSIEMLPAKKKYQCQPWTTSCDSSLSAPGHWVIDRTPNIIAQKKGFPELWGDSYEPRWKPPIAEETGHSIPDREEHSLSGAMHHE